MTCEHCGKEWQFGTCESTVSRRARCERVSAELEDVAAVGISGTRVTAEDLATGESSEVVIKNDYVIICDGGAVASVQAYENGTHVITIKGRGRAS